MVGYNESQRHKRYKQRVARILRSSGYLVAGDGEVDDEFCVFRSADLPPYYLDLCASNGKRVLAVEIDGYRGHKTRRASVKDMWRTADIKSLVKDIEVFRFAFWQLKGMDDATIAEELQICQR